MMTQDELDEYWATPGPKRDRKRYAQHSIEKARLILEQLPVPETKTA